jgi:hypothetical protein
MSARRANVLSVAVQTGFKFHFLGYCGSSTGTARKLKRFLEKDLDVTVLDWQTDFAPGRSILQRIEEAAARLSQ